MTEILKFTMPPRVSASPVARISPTNGSCGTVRTTRLVGSTIPGQSLGIYEGRCVRGSWVRFPPDRRGIDNEDRDAREAEEVRPGVP